MSLNNTNDFMMMMMNEDIYYKGTDVYPDLFYIIIGGLIGFIGIVSALFRDEVEVDEEEEDKDEEEDKFIIFPNTLQVLENGDVYIFKKYNVTFDENGDLRVITGDLLKKMERKKRADERKKKRNEQKLIEAEENRIKEVNRRLLEEQQEIELNRIAEEAHITEVISKLSTIVENREQSQESSPSRRKSKTYIRPLDYGHRYLNDRDQLTTTLRGQSVDVLYRKGSIPKEDRYIAIFTGDTQASEFKTLNQVAVALAARVAINGPNAWTAFKRVRADGAHESIDRLDLA